MLSLQPLPPLASGILIHTRNAQLHRSHQILPRWAPFFTLNPTAWLCPSFMRAELQVVQKETRTDSRRRWRVGWWVDRGEGWREGRRLNLGRLSKSLRFLVVIKDVWETGLHWNHQGLPELKRETMERERVSLKSSVITFSHSCSSPLNITRKKQVVYLLSKVCLKWIFLQVSLKKCFFFTERHK